MLPDAARNMSDAARNVSDATRNNQLNDQQTGRTTDSNLGCQAIAVHNAI